MTPSHYPYSTTYLREHMSRISRGIVVVGLAVIAWVVVASGVYQLVQLFT